MESRRPYHGYIALAVLIPAYILMLAGIRPFSTWFYSLAWWPYIFLVDQAIHRRKGNSLWVNRRKEFFFLIPLSVFFWMVFEGINAYLDNWQYVGITARAWERWIGYFLAYGTVLPGIFETYELLDTLGLYKNSRVKPIPRTNRWHWPFVFAGLFSLFAPIIWPSYFFPLIWGGFVFLLEPVLHLHQGRSLMNEWETGSLRTFFLLLTAGLICGLLWEFWNYWAESKWVYTVPHVGFLKVFEMPVLGFLGFPPFAVMLYVMTNFASLLRNGKSWEADAPVDAAPTMKGLKLLFWIFFFYVYILAGRIIELYTIQSYV